MAKFYDGGTRPVNAKRSQRKNRTPRKQTGNDRVEFSIKEWISEAEPTAYGVLGLLPFEFYSMTIHEFMQAVSGQKTKELNQAYYVALAFNEPNKLTEIIMLDQTLGGR